MVSLVEPGTVFSHSLAEREILAFRKTGQLLIAELDIYSALEYLKQTGIIGRAKQLLGPKDGR